MINNKQCQKSVYFKQSKTLIIDSKTEQNKNEIKEITFSKEDSNNQIYIAVKLMNSVTDVT